MPAVKRRLFNLLAAVSLVLCVATAILCRVNRDRSDYLRYLTPNHHYIVSARPRGVYFAIATSCHDRVPPAGWRIASHHLALGWHAGTQPWPHGYGWQFLTF